MTTRTPRAVSAKKELNQLLEQLHVAYWDAHTTRDVIEYRMEKDPATREKLAYLIRDLSQLIAMMIVEGL